MERIRNLDRYPKILLIVLAVMAVAFGAIYGVTASRVGYLYNDEIFVPRQENGVTLYEAKTGKQVCVFTVTGDTVTLTWGDKTYGPYTLREDPTAVPADHTLSPYMTGIEILDGNNIYFRGGVTHEATDFWLISEDGQHPYSMTYTLSDGTEMDMDGNPIDHCKPTPRQIVSLLRGPELSHKGQWSVFLMGMVLVFITAFSILFADELFYLSICFRVQNAEYAEPSDWAITSRNVSWFLLTVSIGAIFLVGLQ